MLKIAIVDDHPIVSDGIHHLIEQQYDMTMVEVFSNAASLFTWLLNNDLDILLLDIFLPDKNGMEICLELKLHYPDVKIICFSSQQEAVIISEMMKRGASGYLLKNANSSEIIEAIRKVASGEEYFCEKTSLTLKNFRASLKYLPKLTRREKDVLALIKQGNTTNTIAEKLFISPHTVESHRKNLMEKFQVKNMTSVVNRANELGLI